MKTENSWTDRVQRSYRPVVYYSPRAVTSSTGFERKKKLKENGFSILLARRLSRKGSAMTRFVCNLRVVLYAVRFNFKPYTRSTHTRPTPYTFTCCLLSYTPVNNRVQYGIRKKKKKILSVYKTNKPSDNPIVVRYFNVITDNEMLFNILIIKAVAK